MPPSLCAVGQRRQHTPGVDGAEAFMTHTRERETGTNRQGGRGKLERGMWNGGAMEQHKRDEGCVMGVCCECWCV